MRVLAVGMLLLGMATCGGGFSQAQVDMAAKRAGEDAAAKAHAVTKAKMLAIYLKLGATQADAEAKAELDGQQAADAAYALADAAIRKTMPLAPEGKGGGLLAIIGTALLNVAMSTVEAKWGRA